MNAGGSQPERPDLSKMTTEALAGASKSASSGDPSWLAGMAEGAAGSASNYEENVILGASRGHGFAAEKANHLHDVFTGKDAKLVGGDNARNGADRIVDGAHIQTKYCASGAKCISEAFEDGVFRYMKADGTPMQIEVPSDMHEAAVQAMQERIKKGQVPGVNDPAAAGDLVRKGHYTYKQARNIAKFGTVESLSYDAMNGIQLAGTAMGITAAVSFALKTWNGEPFRKALDEACFEGLCVGGVAWLSSVLAAQVGRTSFEGAMRVGTDWVVKQMGSTVSAALANAFRDGSNIYGAAAANHASKLLRGNVATAIVVSSVLSIDDFCMLFTREISGVQAFKNIGKTVSGVAGGSAGLWAGAAVGTAIFPGVGTTVGGLVGGMVGGLSASFAAGKGLDACIDDDSKDLGKILEKTFAELANDYLLSEAEAKSAIAEFKVLDIAKLMRSMQASADKPAYAIATWTPFIEEQVRCRKKIILPTEDELATAIRDLIDRLGQGAEAGDGPAQPAKARTSSDETRGAAEAGTGKTIRTLGSMIAAYEHVLHDGDDVYCGAGLTNEKGRGKQKKARLSFAEGAKADAHVLIDSTVWGSVSEGFYFTETHIYGKELFEDGHVFHIDKIKSIRVDKEDRALIINGQSIKWLGEQVTPKMEIIVKCIERYLAQFQ